MRIRVVFSLVLASAVFASAAGVVVKKALSVDVSKQKQLIANGGLETVDGAVLRGWDGWELGYEVDGEIKHGGRFSARCRNGSVEEHRGLTYVVELNQETPTPIVAECWSKAEGVTGGRDPNYSLYLDLVYTDGSPLWGQIAAFKPGTHDWRKRSVTVVPAKPIKEVMVHGIFRRRAGTAWFDDFKLWELSLPDGVVQFDAVAVTRGGGAEPQAVAGPLSLPTAFFLRDVAAQSSFIQPELSVESRPDGTLVARGAAESLQLELSVIYRDIGDALRLDGTVRDLTGGDRAVTVYCSHAVNALGWRWWDDQRASRPIEAGKAYRNSVTVGAGANRTAAKYPLACISGGEAALCVAAPLDVPRLYRFAYEAGSQELYAAVDVGLSPATRKFPSQASFSFVLYRCDPAWGFRAALQRYYELFPHCFVKRNRKEGIWMPFTDIATVAGFADFGFQFQEGAPNVAFDERHGIDSFVYVEPASHWVSMPKDMERTNDRALAYIRELAAAGKEQAQASLTSAVSGPDGEWQGGVTKAPWCDGALYYLNPSPNVVRDSAGTVRQFDHEWRRIDAAFKNATAQRGAWRSGPKGYEIVEGEGRNGSRCVKLTRTEADAAAGASQAIVVDQKQATPLIARAWTKAAGGTGDRDKDYSLYIDLKYVDGTPGWGFMVAAETGTHDWQLLEQTIRPEKPVRSLSFHLLFRGSHAGTVWFDDAFLAEEGRDRNLVRQGDFEPAASDALLKPELDGTYIDSFEMAATMLNYRREHFAQTETPLVFDAEGRVCQMGIFNTVAFAGELASRMQANNKMMFANSTPHRFPWGAAHLDVMGTETNWAPGGKYTPNADSVMNYRRAICWQRPYLLLLNTVYDDFKPEWVELYFKRCTAYAIFPSFFSHNAADDPYWGRPDLYNRDRPLFKKYIPTIQALNAAGWAPVTHARSSNAAVYVERFGKPGGEIYLTLFNDSDTTQTTKVSVDHKALALTEIPAQLRAGELTIEPQDVMVFKLAGEG